MESGKENSRVPLPGVLVDIVATKPRQRCARLCALFLLAGSLVRRTLDCRCHGWFLTRFCLGRDCQQLWLFGMYLPEKWDASDTPGLLPSESHRTPAYGATVVKRIAQRDLEPVRGQATFAQERPPSHPPKRVSPEFVYGPGKWASRRSDVHLRTGGEEMAEPTAACHATTCMAETGRVVVEYALE
eukprot:scaffold115_cov304-Prasinococcus_capsulatus_cf.AAC.17